MKAIKILLVEDNEDDVLITKRVFQKTKIANELYVASSGEDALDFIYHRGQYAQKEPPYPGLILLDIEMPGMNGFEVLRRLKADSDYKKIPVAMLTISDREEEMARSYEDGACCYITKPVDFNKLIKIIQTLDIYWTLVSKTP